jgi:uncharacterized protein (DUF1697 family)
MNLGNRRLKMDELRRLFEEMKFSDVATFIASGNVIFSSKLADTQKLQETIAKSLERSLGYSVDTFVRTRAEIAAIAEFEPFPKTEMENPNFTVLAILIHHPLTAAQAKALIACRTEIDEFCVHGREIYWLCRIKMSESKVWTTPQMKAVRLPTSTMRNTTTLRKLAALYPPRS